MKIFFICLLLLPFFSLKSKADSDTFVINLKNGSGEKIDISLIMKIQTENITVINEQNKQAKLLVATENFPNPFREQTSIEFETGMSGNAETIIFDNTENQIQKLESIECQTGKNILQWNCLDKHNNEIQSGAYNYEVHFGNEVLSKKMIMFGGKK